MSSDADLIARMDQWNASLGELVTLTAAHLKHCPQQALGCPGSRVSKTIEALKPQQTITMLELALVRLARGSASIYEPSFVCWVPNRPGEDPDDHEHDSAIPCDWGWRCNGNGDGCTFRTDTVPCPKHAPVHVPELRLVECVTEPRHWLWVHRNDDYGHGCPLCWVDQKNAQLAPLVHAQLLREHRWCWATNRVKRALIRLRVMRMSGWSSDCRYRMGHTRAKWRWSR